MAKTLPDITLSKDELMYLKDNLNQYHSGCEGIIIKGEDPRVVRKIFLYDIDEAYTKPREKVEQMRQNKLKKIQILGNMHQLKNDLKVTRTISHEGIFMGYEMVSSFPQFPLDTNPLYVENLIPYLKRLRDILEDYHKHGIVFGDVKANNVLQNQEFDIVSFCDVDNIQVGNLPIDLPNFCIQRFQQEDGLIPEAVDHYMFNLLTLSELFYGSKFYRDVEEKIKRGDFPTGLTKESYKILTKMAECKNTCPTGYIIDNL